MNTFKIVVAGVGGQGTLLASRLLAEAAIKSGLHVKIGETYGMAQRGGPVMDFSIEEVLHNIAVRVQNLTETQLFVIIGILVILTIKLT